MVTEAERKVSAADQSATFPHHASLSPVFFVRRKSPPNHGEEAHDDRGVMKGIRFEELGFAHGFKFLWIADEHAVDGELHLRLPPWFHNSCCPIHIQELELGFDDAIVRHGLVVPSADGTGSVGKPIAGRRLPGLRGAEDHVQNSCQHRRSRRWQLS